MPRNRDQKLKRGDENYDIVRVESYIDEEGKIRRAVCQTKQDTEMKVWFKYEEKVLSHPFWEIPNPSVFFNGKKWKPDPPHWMKKGKSKKNPTGRYPGDQSNKDFQGYQQDYQQPSGQYPRNQYPRDQYNYQQPTGQYPRDQSEMDIQGYQHTGPQPDGHHPRDQYNGRPDGGYQYRDNREVSRGRPREVVRESYGERYRSRERSRDRYDRQTQGGQSTSRNRSPRRQRRDHPREDHSRRSPSRDPRFYSREESRDHSRGEGRYEERNSDPGYGGRR